ncbi:PQQ-binding-like beta-propeller repeat protein [Natrinema hispanicum]|uniref:Tat (Twin-arginine translocation) pathway signal sequence n=1 Tax=Natrinema hispanicum TaxID=392421 RepID=A0A1G6Z2H6_9EURY|nr:PQQ-binding-like beta-propeller repeat protein [Natrinema hispanicum]SDD96820.1 Tat (twin-arginine translocation) pathway signal sequence [Natrinema hispanicum]SET84238.1 Tat (twin-arginine translocation) pathway signal sequence [Natrinema hispanicum]
MDRRKFLYGSGTAVGGGLLGTYGLTSEASAQETATDAQTQAQAQLQQLEGEWPKFRYDLANTGHAVPETGPGQPVSIRWTYTTGDALGSSSPAVVDGTVYFGSRDGNLRAIDAETGALEWRRLLVDDPIGIVFSSPAVADGTIYIGNSNLFALDAETGSIQWTFDPMEGLGEEIPHNVFSPTVADGTVYFGTTYRVYEAGWMIQMGNLIALDADTGEELWRFTPAGPISNVPAVVDGTVYTGTSGLYRSRWDEIEGEIIEPIAIGQMYAIDAETGSVESSIPTRVSTSPVVTDDSIYYAHQDTVTALDRVTSAVQWSLVRSPMMAMSDLAVTDDMVFSAAWGFEPREDPADRLRDYWILSGIDADDGTEIWRHDARTEFAPNESGRIFSSPGVADGTVYVGSADELVPETDPWTLQGRLHAFDAATGEAEWRGETGDWVWSSPAIAGGTAYIGSNDRKMYAFEGSPVEEPSASITFADQDSDGLSVVVQEVTLSNGGYIEITDTDGVVRGQSDNLEAGTHEDVEITLAPQVTETQTLTVTVFMPTGEPYLVDDAPVSAAATITIPPEPPTPEATITFADQESDGRSVVVQQVQLSHGGFIEITDPNGRVVGRSEPLEPERLYEDLEVAITLFEPNGAASPAVDPQAATATQQETGGDPEEANLDEPMIIELTATVYRDIDVPYLFDNEPVTATALVTVLDPVERTATITFADQESNSESVVVNNVDLSHGGYVKVTDAEGTVRGQSAILPPGPHQSVTIHLSPVLDATQELTATVFTPGGEAYLVDGEPVSATALITLVEPEGPKASLTFKGQKSDGSSVVIREIDLSHGGFVEITDAEGVRRGITPMLDAGRYTDFEVVLTSPLTKSQELTATAYRDVDVPYLEDGEPVSDTAWIIVYPDEKKKKKDKKNIDFLCSFRLFLRKIFSF